MELKTQLQRAGLWLLVAALALPAAFFVTVLTFPFWRWLDEVSGIESFGHSGPAEWCYWLVYAILMLTVILIWLFNKE